MRHPFWIANSLLLLFVVLVSIFAYFSRVRIPRREDIEPESYVRPKKKQIFDINIKKIYENDLFDTFRKEVPVYQEPEYHLEIPAPPPQEEIVTPTIPEPVFLDPLDITLKGIIVVSRDEQKNRVIIADNTTDTERTYKVGDMIEDAQLIRIFNNKIVLLRSNGQQEVLYLREQDAQLDPTYNAMNNWKDVVQQTSQNTFLVSPRNFIERVKNLAQFIDMIGLSTAYQHGLSMGCRVGELTPESLGIHLGLQSGDIITSINDIPATTTPERLQIYKTIINMKDNDVIKVHLIRQGTPLELQFTLKSFGEKKIPGATFTPSPEQELKHKTDILRQKHKFAPTIDELRKKERQLMLGHGHIARS